MMKYIKKTSLLIIAVGILLSHIPIVEAKASWKVNLEVIGPSTPNPEKIVKDPELITTDEYIISSSCKFNHSGGVRINKKQVNFSIFNQNNEDIIEPDFTIKDENKPTAGMAVGITIEEERHVYWDMEKVAPELSVTIMEKRDRYVCTYKNPPNAGTPLNPGGGLNNGGGPVVSINCAIYAPIIDLEEPSGYCPAYEGCIWTGVMDTGIDDWKTIYDKNINVQNKNSISVKKNGTEISEYTEIVKNLYEKCQEAAVERAQTVASWYVVPSYDIELSDSNNINGSDTVKLMGSKAHSVYYRYPEDAYGNNLFQKYLKDYDYNINIEAVAADLKDVRIKLSEDEVDKLLEKNIRDENGELIDVFAISVYSYYENKGTCMNLKTGEASYLNSINQTCNASEEIEIENTTNPDGTVHWHYFLPLNAKGLDDVIIDMRQRYDQSKLDFATCLAFMQHNYISSNGNSKPISYVDIIRPANNGGGRFKGDYMCFPSGGGNCDSPGVTWSGNESIDYTEIKNNGCVQSTRKQLEVNQLFYKESTDNKLNGFNFYYQPINVEKSDQISIIFPNGITTNTLWKEWYQNQNSPAALEQNKSPNLEDSFDTITYIASNISTNDIRQYNKNNPYTSWQNMNTDGTSGFIDSNGVIERKSINSVYKLGCGPLNSHQYLLNNAGQQILDENGNPKINTLYIPECAT